ncbi:bifunctional UDP-N-acetylmuramoyl-tripeptide:D-alanyl-D-alanine ligase/alanine racemase [Sphingobacterium wenxiniae]|uniref:Alanine racemase n=1 Tax=Sphingobacterium wenxiniae TaxID=683125 RepID=A0A1I6QLI0_9SPHI|nr:bifunctional UDP-N-acetylmuramoyl-tripeptide:D-alanyl-D-alanine ligase/alanine racemase [Sphingobacterium wenxiniae]SFS53276.1 alanine racemase [Sphingobacterium wenxiniae]
MYSILAISEIIKATETVWQNPEQPIQYLVYDSRKVVDAKHSLFFALKKVRNGHDFIADAYDRGIRNFVVSERSVDTEFYVGAQFLWVKDTLAALQQLAKYHREQFHKPVIGITGSNGKTVIKEWLSQLLQHDKKVYQSPKSYNSQIGVALGLWNLSEEYDCAIIEAGISEPDEMEALADMIQPQIGIFTNIGIAHASGFSSKEQKIKEKAKLFNSAEAIIFPSKYDLAPYFPSSKTLFSVGERKTDQVQVLKIEETDKLQTCIQVCYNGEITTFQIPFRDKASIENMLICLTVMLFLGYTLDTVVPLLSKLKQVEMRLQLKKGINNCSIIDDTYSNDLASLQIALDFLNQQKQHSQKTIVLSDMEGMDERLRSKLLRVMENQQLFRMILVGEGLRYLQGKLSTPIYWYRTTESLIEHMEKIDFRNESILIKGSRTYQLEQISNLLVAKSHETVLEINLKAIEGNLQKYRSLLPNNVKMMAMVKAFSYGSGSFEIANLLQFNKVDYLTVAFADEGIELRQHGIDLPIMVLSPDEQVFSQLVNHKLEPEIYSFRILHAFLSFLERRGIKNYPIHIKIDTGMHRLGFLPEEIPHLQETLLATQVVQVKSVFSHLVASGEQLQDNFTQKQIALYIDLAKDLENKLGYTLIKHIANTSAITRWPQAYLDMVRLGIGLYGVNAEHSSLQLDTVSQLKTTVTQIKSLKKGETVGYDRKGLLYRDSRIATVKIGYADGYDRRFGNGTGKMLINGHLVPTVGNICMDMCMLDVTGGNVNEEDEVLVFPNLSEAAESIGTIPYELLVNISSRVKRVYFYE